MSVTTALQTKLDAVTASTSNNDLLILAKAAQTNQRDFNLTKIRAEVARRVNAANNGTSATDLLILGKIEDALKAGSLSEYQINETKVINSKDKLVTELNGSVWLQGGQTLDNVSEYPDASRTVVTEIDPDGQVFLGQIPGSISNDRVNDSHLHAMRYRDVAWDATNKRWLVTTSANVYAFNKDFSKCLFTRHGQKLFDGVDPSYKKDTNYDLHGICIHGSNVYLGYRTSAGHSSYGWIAKLNLDMSSGSILISGNSQLRDPFPFITQANKLMVNSSYNAAIKEFNLNGTATGLYHSYHSSNGRWFGMLDIGSHYLVNYYYSSSYYIYKMDKSSYALTKVGTLVTDNPMGLERHPDGGYIVTCSASSLLLTVSTAYAETGKITAQGVRYSGRPTINSEGDVDSLRISGETIIREKIDKDWNVSSETLPLHPFGRFREGYGYGGNYPHIEVGTIDANTGLFRNITYTPEVTDNTNDFVRSKTWQAQLKHAKGIDLPADRQPDIVTQSSTMMYAIYISGSNPYTYDVYNINADMNVLGKKTFTSANAYQYAAVTSGKLLFRKTYADPKIYKYNLSTMAAEGEHAVSASYRGLSYYSDTHYALYDTARRLRTYTVTGSAGTTISVGSVSWDQANWQYLGQSDTGDAVAVIDNVASNGTIALTMKGLAGGKNTLACQRIISKGIKNKASGQFRGAMLNGFTYYFNDNSIVKFHYNTASNQGVGLALDIRIQNFKDHITAWFFNPDEKCWYLGGNALDVWRLKENGELTFMGCLLDQLESLGLTMLFDKSSRMRDLVVKNGVINGLLSDYLVDDYTQASNTAVYQVQRIEGTPRMPNFIGYNSDSGAFILAGSGYSYKHEHWILLRGTDHYTKPFSDKGGAMVNAGMGNNLKYYRCAIDTYADKSLVHKAGGILVVDLYSRSSPTQHLPKDQCTTKQHFLQLDNTYWSGHYRMDPEGFWFGSSNSTSNDGASHCTLFDKNLEPLRSGRFFNIARSPRTFQNFIVTETDYWLCESTNWYRYGQKEYGFSHSDDLSAVFPSSSRGLGYLNDMFFPLAPNALLASVSRLSPVRMTLPVIFADGMTDFHLDNNGMAANEPLTNLFHRIPLRHKDVVGLLEAQPDVYVRIK